MSVNMNQCPQTPPAVVWFKRDLRLTDHEPLLAAVQSQQPLLLIYILEPSLVADGHYDERHWRFVLQSLQDLNQQLAPLGTQVYCFHDEAIEVLQALKDRTGFNALYSSEETGLGLTFSRDKAVAAWCEEASIRWQEFPSGAVVRGLTHRLNWDDHWQAMMRAPLVTPELSHVSWCALPDYKMPDFPLTWTSRQSGMQTGGPTLAWQTLTSFYDGRGKNYHRQLSSPLTSRTACTRLSPYLAWGNISLREVYQDLLSRWQTPGWRRALVALSSRLHWHCHFIQKFESECAMEFRPVNHGYGQFPYRTDEGVAEDVQAWQTGRTGIPMIDACMRALIATGYINFRMRAMLVSFLCHHLNIDWREAAKPLARYFLDFEPGIHYPQLQMQAGVTGTNTLRIYNPVKQAQDQDPDGQFIKRWLPELAQVPVPQCFAPWTMTAMEESFYGCTLGEDYPLPIIDLEQAARDARERLWGFRNTSAVKADKGRILARHVRPESAQQPLRF
ncbi:FAD-binding domain-containing protein [Pokkaliibacter sp. CJK22405]|uniref:FAD-binding domain-containing protein n=1 Tax=Pokkaliibacter sp. CJK22405 TaxID=3384615 RepID=UPI003984D10C